MFGKSWLSAGLVFLYAALFATAAAAGERLVDVTATGQGRTAEAARKAAGENAVKDAIIKEFGEAFFRAHSAALGEAVKTQAESFLTQVQPGDPAQAGENRVSVRIQAKLWMDRLKAEVERITGQSGAPAPDSGQGPAGGGADAREASGGGQDEVIVTGLGVDADAALRNALRNAVRQVVGTLVNAQELISNDELIKDEILVHSAGFVRSHRMIGRPSTNEDGLVEVQISAIVNRSTLEQKMRSSGIIGEKKIDSGTRQGFVDDARSVRVARETQAEANQSAEDLLETLFEDFQDRMLDTLDVSVKGRLRSNARAGAIEADVVVAVNRPKYSAFTRDLQGSLEKILGRPVIRNVDTWITADRIQMRGNIFERDEAGVAICSVAPAGKDNAIARSQWRVYRCDPEVVRTSILPKIPEKKTWSTWTRSSSTGKQKINLRM